MKARAILIAVVAIAIIGAGTYYGRIVSPKEDRPCSIVDIQKEVKRTSDRIAQYLKVSKEVIGLSTEGGVQDNYRDERGNTPFIRQTFYGETFRSELDYYLSNGKVFFISVDRLEYEKPISEDSNVTIKTTISRDFYLTENERLCSWYLDDVQQGNDPKTQEFVAFIISTLKLGAE